MKKVIRFVIALAVMTAVVAAAYVFVLKPAAAPADNGRIRVVTAANFWGDIARQIGGSRVSVTSLINDAEADPHLFEPGAAGAGAVATADVVIVNGLGYDEFLDKALAAAPASGRQVLRAAEASGTPAGSNPHIWYDPAKALAVADALRATLANEDPEHAHDYQKNFDSFSAALKPVMAAAERIMAGRPGTAVAYTERVPEYMLAAAGLQILTPPGFAEAIEAGNDASPADTAAMEELIKQHKIQALLYNSQATSPITNRVRELAVSAGIPVVPVSETMPPNEPDFQTWQLHQINALGEALGVR